jgi:hypothetical protein
MRKTRSNKFNRFKTNKKRYPNTKFIERLTGKFIIDSNFRSYVPHILMQFRQLTKKATSPKIQALTKQLRIT